MPNNYNSSFTGQHNDEYDTRITALETTIVSLQIENASLVSQLTSLESQITTILNKFNDYLPLTGGTLTGELNCTGTIRLKGTDLRLETSGPNSNDSGDLVYFYGNGNEKMRIWSANEYTTKTSPNFRQYKQDGTGIYSGSLALN